MKSQGSCINKPASKYSPAPVIYNRSLFKMGATALLSISTTLPPVTESRPPGLPQSKQATTRPFQASPFATP